MVSISNRITPTNGHLLTRATFSCPSGPSIHYKALATTTTTEATTSLLNEVALIPTCSKCQRLENFPGVEFLGTAPKFTMRKKNSSSWISRHCREVMAKKFTKKSDVCAKLSVCLLKPLWCSRCRCRHVVSSSVLTYTDHLKTVTSIISALQLLEQPPTTTLIQRWTMCNLFS